MFELQIDTFANAFIVLPGLNCRWPLFESLSSYSFIPLTDGEVAKVRSHFSGICLPYSLDHRVGEWRSSCGNMADIYTSVSGCNCVLALTFGEESRGVCDKGPVSCSWRVWEDWPSSELTTLSSKPDLVAEYSLAYKERYFWRISCLLLYRVYLKPHVPF